jgi:ankyrin repeat protein
MTALHATSKQGHTEVVRLLLEKRADIEAKTDVSVVSALMWDSSADPLPGGIVATGRRLAKRL